MHGYFQRSYDAKRTRLAHVMKLLEWRVSQASASAEMVEEVSAQETQHPLAQPRQRHGAVLCPFGDHPLRRAEQAAPLDHFGNERVPLGQRLLCFFRHEPSNDIRWRREYIGHGVGED